MLTEKQLDEIKEHLEKAQNPLFFFDNDVDGLCSFLVLRRFINRGRGVVIKSSPDLNITYARKVYELNPDYIFILDKPLVSKDFLNEMRKLNLPVVWIDHHGVIAEDLSEVNYYNPSLDGGSSEPTTYLCYQATKKKEDEWIALTGCLADGYIPDFINRVREKYPELSKECKSAFQCVYETTIGKIIRILSFGLKDRTSNVIKMLKFLVDINSPYDILEENVKTFSFHKRFEQINSKYKKLLEKAKSETKGKLIYFQYGGDLSISAEIANELSYFYHDKIVVVAYISGARANISLRGKNVRKLTLDAIAGLEGARGGGHKDATGASLLAEDLPKFKSSIEELLSHKNPKD